MRCLGVKGFTKGVCCRALVSGFRVCGLGIRV